MDPVYLEIARNQEIRLCGSCDAISVGGHRIGKIWAGRLHWAPRRIHRSGLYTFLKLVYQIRYESTTDPEWVRVYRRSRFASDYARSHVHRLIPRHLADYDRASVAYLLHKSLPVPATLELVAQRVWRWTQRRTS